MTPEQELIEQLMKEKEQLNQSNKDLKKKVKDMTKNNLREKVERDMRDKAKHVEHQQEI